MKKPDNRLLTLDKALDFVQSEMAKLDPEWDSTIEIAKHKAGTDAFGQVNASLTVRLNYANLPTAGSAPGQDQMKVLETRVHVKRVQCPQCESSLSVPLNVQIEIQPEKGWQTTPNPEVQV